MHEARLSLGMGQKDNIQRRRRFFSDLLGIGEGVLDRFRRLAIERYKNANGIGHRRIFSWRHPQMGRASKGSRFSDQAAPSPFGGAGGILPTRLPMKSTKGPMSSPALALSSAAI